MTAPLRVAAAQLQMARTPSPQAFWDGIARVVAEAAARGVQVVQLPEYFTLALALERAGPFKERVRSLAAEHADAAAVLQQLAIAHGVWIVGGTVPVLTASGTVVNRCYVAAPDGSLQEQDKINMTRFEAETWDVRGADVLANMTVAGVRAAVLICYDVEFAQLALLLRDMDVQLLFVPSCTESWHGYWRVRHCAQARAVELQLFTVVSSLVGGVPDIYDVDTHWGQGAVLSPCDQGFPYRGILAEGQLGHADLVQADLDFAALERIRADGAVLNRRDALALKTRPVRAAKAR